jgi:hypothetical protein
MSPTARLHAVLHLPGIEPRSSIPQPTHFRLLPELSESLWEVRNEQADMLERYPVTQRTKRSTQGA